MGRTDAIKEKILKLGSKQKLGALLKYADNAEDDVRMTVAMAMGMMAMMVDTRKVVSMWSKTASAVCSLVTGKPIHAALCSAEKSTSPVTAART